MNTESPERVIANQVSMSHAETMKPGMTLPLSAIALAVGISLVLWAILFAAVIGGYKAIEAVL
jgi:hypothetical protein